MSTSLVASVATAFDAFNSTYYYSPGNGVAYFSLDPSFTAPAQTDLWRQAETIEVAEDYIDFMGTPSADDKYFISTLIDGLNEHTSGTNDFASWDTYNDDVMWATIALIRAYEQTGTEAYITQAKNQFDAVYARAYSSDVGGGLWWNTENSTKNACINGPAAIAAQLLYNNGQGDDYHGKALSLYDWLKGALFDSTTGAVNDHINADGTVATGSRTYNQGSFIGAAILLADGNMRSSFVGDAEMALNYTRYFITSTNQYGFNILDTEATDNTGAGDLAGFKGIFVRYAAKYVALAEDHEAGEWLVKNANQIWWERNAQNITWTNWKTPTPDVGSGTTLYSWGSSSAVSGVIAGATAWNAGNHL